MNADEGTGKVEMREGMGRQVVYRTLQWGEEVLLPDLVVPIRVNMVPCEERENTTLYIQDHVEVMNFTE